MGSGSSSHAAKQTNVPPAPSPDPPVYTPVPQYAQSVPQQQMYYNQQWPPPGTPPHVAQPTPPPPTQWTDGDRCPRVLEGPDYLPDVPDDVANSWKLTCRMCSLHMNDEITQRAQSTPEGMLTYSVHRHGHVPMHVIHTPKPYSDKTSFTELDNHAIKAPSHLNADFSRLVGYLVQPARTELQRTRVLFRWVSAQNVSNMSIPDRPAENTPDWYLKQIQQKKTYLYPVLFLNLCRYAGLTCSYVRGYAKSARLFPGTKYVGTEPMGTWTVVRIDGCWGFVDSHWGSFSVIDDDDDKELEDLQSQIAIDEFYFLPNPLHYLSSHCPSDPSWQLIDNPIPLSDFEAHVKCNQRFFAHKLRLLSHHNGLVETVDGTVDIHIGYRAEDEDGIQFYYNLKTKEERSRWRGIKLDRFVTQLRKKGAAVFTITPPEKGRFLFELFFGLKGQSFYHYACEYMVLCSQALPPEENDPIPAWKGIWGPGKMVMEKGMVAVSHKSPYVQCPNGKAEIVFSSPGDHNFLAKLYETSMDETHLKRYVAYEIVDDEVKFYVNLPTASKHGLGIFTQEGNDENAYVLLCNYITQCQADDSSINEQPFPAVPRGRFGPVLPDFQELGLSATGSAFVECETGELQLSLKGSHALTYSHELFWETLNEKVNMSEYVQRQVVDGNVEFLLRLPRIGMYRLAVYAEEAGRTGAPRNVYNYCINCTGTQLDVEPFPAASATFVEPPLSHEDTEERFIQSEHGDIKIIFGKGTPKGIEHKLICLLDGEEVDVSSYAFIQDNPDNEEETVVHLRLKEAGKYKLSLSTKDPDEEGRTTLSCYVIQTMKGMEDCTEFPERLLGWWSDYQMYEPLSRLLKAKETFKFKGCFPRAAEVAVMLPTSEWIQLKKGEGNDWEEVVTMPGNKYAGQAVTVNVLPDTEDGDYTEVLGYVVEKGEDTGHEEEDQIPRLQPEDTEEDLFEGQMEEYQMVLRQHRRTIADEMNPEKVIPRFEENRFIDEEEALELTEQLPNNPNEVNKQLLNVVQREGEDAFITLRDVMKETGQSKIMDVIQDVVIVVPDNKLDKLRKKLDEATQAKNKGRLEKIMAECREHGMDEDDDVLKEAQRTLDLIEARQGLKKAIKTRHRDQLQASLKAAQPFKNELRKHMNEAEEILEKIKRLDKLRHAIMAMNQTTIAEIKTYNNPPPAVYKVMMATFLLLGNTKAQVDDWVSLLALIGKTGKQSLKRRVKNCEPANISPDTAAEAKQCLGDLSLDGVRDQSSGAATFYVWSVGIISEVEEIALNKQNENTKATG
ncbi:uncharacterized protein [Branchiostoma lanceolatum]|uniref:uncharacterized protein n=1 Tax=Branchiostoma lanceolatum TaxID=7740 RepID=UPI0034518A21